MITVKATINLDALRHNLSRVKHAAPDSKIISVIKANAYGHGVLPVAKALLESDCFAVARIDEALLLRESCLKNGITKEIIILEGVFSVEEYLQCMALKLIPVVNSLEQFQWLQDSLESENSLEPENSLERADKNSELNYWLKIDTGMHRLGLSEDELMVLIKKYQQPGENCLPSGFISHFACADEIDNPLNQIQISQFNQQYQQLSILKELPDIDKSMANSAAILSLPEAHFDWVRPGIMLYGISPFETSNIPRNGLDEQLKPVMTLSSELIAIKKLKKGDCIGYGASWCCPEDMTIGVISIGYGDGYPRHASCGTPVLIHGTEVPLVGRVSMDMITVDLRRLEQKSIAFQIGDKVILWGEGLPIERVSRKAGTIAYELLCQITQRVSFEYE